MATDDKNPEQSKSQDSGSDGDKGKLFFGKYKTLEEAESGHKELERSFHAKAQEAATYKEIVDRVGTEPRQTQQQSYGNPQTQDRGVQELTEFYANPLGWKEKVKQEAVAEATQLISGQVQKSQDVEKRVTAWASRNPDVSEHQDLLEVYVKRTDARLSPENRLDLAAGEVRKRLATLRGTKAGDSKPDPNTMDGDSGSYRDDGSGNQRQQSQQQSPASGEQELVKLVAERNKNRIKRPGTHH